jgi:hypothetical protein
MVLELLWRLCIKDQEQEAPLHRRRGGARMNVIKLCLVQCTLLQQFETIIYLGECICKIILFIKYNPNSTCRDNYKKKVHSAQQGAVVNSYWLLLVTIVLVAPCNQPSMPPVKTCCKYHDRDREWRYLIPLFWSQLQVWQVQDFHCFRDVLTAFCGSDLL